MSDTTRITVNGIGAAAENNGIDLDGQCLMTRPTEIDEWAEGKRLLWLIDNGYDLSIDLDTSSPWLHAVATNMTIVPNERWTDPDLSWITALLQPGSPINPLTLWQLQEPELPVTFAFRTKSAASGLFRLTTYSTEEKRATIEIKAT
ncbi:MAG: hypothetical protein PHG65_13220 [Kiritimatiellae bacterium]|nr:hypothetical protein [Kiritimatiellia bacterium]